MRILLLLYWLENQGGHKGLQLKWTCSSDPQVDPKKRRLNSGQRLFGNINLIWSEKLSRTWSVGHFQHTPTIAERRLVAAAYRRPARPYLWRTNQSSWLLSLSELRRISSRWFAPLWAPLKWRARGSAPCYMWSFPIPAAVPRRNTLLRSKVVKGTSFLLLQRS